MGIVTSQLQALLQLDVRSAIGLLVWGNLAMGILVTGYYLFNHFNFRMRNTLMFGIAKYLQMLAWFLLFCRGFLPEIATVHMGNSILMVGFALEVGALATHAPGFDARGRVLLVAVTVFCLLAFNIVELILQSSNIRIGTASAATVAIFLPPIVRYVFHRDTTRVKRGIGIAYLVFLGIVLARSVYGFSNSRVELFSGGVLQSLTFIVTNLMMIVGTTSLLLISKEDADIRLAELATHDPLTGLPNRRHFTEMAGPVLERHTRLQKPVSILFLDIDNFKQTNDRYGHAFGDEVLQEMGKAIHASIRSFDMCCRIGGEEFVILFDGAAEHDGLHAGERVLESIRACHFPAHPEYRLTASAGLYAAVPYRGQQMDVLMERSDRALLEAKRSGKNCIHLYVEPAVGAAGEPVRDPAVVQQMDMSRKAHMDQKPDVGQQADVDRKPFTGQVDDAVPHRVQ